LLRLKPEEARRLRRQIVELLILEARAGVIVASHGGSEDDRRGALIRAISHLDQAERLDTALPSVLFAERARYHAALGMPIWPRATASAPPRSLQPRAAT